MLRMSPLVPGYPLDRPRPMLPPVPPAGDGSFRPYGVRPMKADAFVSDSDPRLVYTYLGVGQDHNGEYYRAGVLSDGETVKVRATPGTTPYTGSTR